MRPKILVVDDEAIAREVTCALLADCGADLVEAADGCAALALARENDCALVLLDVQMHGMNGYRVAEALRRDGRTAHLPIVFVSGALRDEPTSLEQLLGEADLLIEKPVNPELLRQVVRMVLRQRERQLRQATSRGAAADRRELEQLRRENFELRLVGAARTLRSGIA